MEILLREDYNKNYCFMEIRYFDAESSILLFILFSLTFFHSCLPCCVPFHYNSLSEIRPHRNKTVIRDMRIPKFPLF